MIWEFPKVPQEAAREQAWDHLKSVLPSSPQANVLIFFLSGPQVLDSVENFPH